MRQEKHSTEIRNPRPEEKEDILRLQALSFGKDVPFFRRIWDTDPRHSDGPARLLLEKGRRVGYLRYAPWKMHLRGRVVRFGGLAEVCTLPSARGKGYLRMMMEEILPDHIGRGVFINLLHGDPNLYRRFGWETACDFVSVSREVADLSFPRVSGRVRRFQPKDLPALKALYDQKAKAMPIMVDRDDLHWKGCVFRKASFDGPKPWVYEGARGIEGYAFIKTSRLGKGPARDIHFSELTVLSMNAAWGLAARACERAGPGDVLTSRGPGGHLPPAASPWGGPGTQIKIGGGSMARLVDAQGFINMLGPGVGNFAGTVVLKIQDPFSFLHRDLVELRGLGNLRAVKRSPRARLPNLVKLGVGSLSQLVLGYKNAGELAALGRLSGPSEAVSRLMKAFPPLTGYQEELDDY